MMLIELPYVRERAVEYARTWALERNPLFPNFAGIGGDCTNFVSQCVLAGCCLMNDTLDFGWYYFSPTDRAPAWTGVKYFYDFMTMAPEFVRENGGIGPYGREILLQDAEIGDVIQLADRQGMYYHTLIISGFSGGDPLVCAHTDDALDRPLSSYRYAQERVIHIMGARGDFDSLACYEGLLSGEVYRQPEIRIGDAILTRTREESNG